MKRSEPVSHSRRPWNAPRPSLLTISGEVKIRPFSVNDLNAILKIRDSCRAISGWRARDYEQLAGDPRGMILVAESGACMPPEILGFSTAYRVDTEAELWNIAVAPAHRRQGTARALLQHNCRRLSDAGAQRLFLEVRESNLPAMELYRTLGFVLLSRRKDYYQNPKEDAHVLVRKLDLSDI